MCWHAFKDGTCLGLKLPPRKGLSARGNSPQRTKYYPSQSTITFLNSFFDLNLSTILEPGHTTTSLVADQMIQFAQAVGLEVTLASYGLPVDLLPRASGSFPVYLIGPFRKTHCSSVICTIIGDIVVSQSPHSSPTVTGLTVTSDKKINATPRQNPIAESNISPLTGVLEMVDPEDVPVVVLAQQGQLK